MKVATAKAKNKAVYPGKEIEECIRDFLAQEGAMQAVLHGTAGSAKPSGSNSVGPRPVLDSLVVVEMLCELESKVPFELPDSLVRAGGYDSVDQVVQHLVPQLQKRWDKHQEEKD